MPIESTRYRDYHDKLCYYLVHTEFALLHDRMLHEKERTQFPIVFLVGKINRFCLRNILHVINCCLIFTYHLECLYEISKKEEKDKKDAICNSTLKVYLQWDDERNVDTPKSKR